MTGSDSKQDCTVWVVDDDASIRWVLERALRQSGMDIASFEDSERVILALHDSRPDVLVTDIRMPGEDGLRLLDVMRERHPQIPVIMITGHSDLDSAVAAYQGGAFEYLPKPFDIDEAVDLVRRAAAFAGPRADVGQPREPLPRLIGRAPAMQHVFRTIGRLSRSSMAVLITGESGTGKELVARALHQHSPRADRPFIALNMSAVPGELLESELFGHERGAFTGADARREGRFEQADSGTLFLDEIGDMPLALQTRLLRVLAEGEFYRVGGHAPIMVDVRVIAATHQDLAGRVSAGLFREDLFHRLNVIRLDVPPLRKRQEDIPQLLQHYLHEAARELGVAAKSLSEEVVAYLEASDWPGNVRQLVNVCRRLTVEAPGSEIRLEDIPPELGGQAREAGGRRAWTEPLTRWAIAELDKGEDSLLDMAMPELERVLIRVAMAKARGQRKHAARLLGWGRNTLTRKIGELDMEEEFQ